MGLIDAMRRLRADGATADKQSINFAAMHEIWLWQGRCRCRNCSYTADCKKDRKAASGAGFPCYRPATSADYRSAQRLIDKLTPILKQHPDD